jgi:Flp pilus assembly pilin Flp
MMAIICEKMDMFVAKAKKGTSRFIKEEHGDFGVSQIAMIVVSVVIIGMIFLTVQDRLPALFDSFWTAIQDWFSSMNIM